MYFDKLGTTEYNGTTIPDILKRITLSGNISTSNLVDQYTIIEGETPESLSYNYYGSVDYYWTILLLNNIRSRYFNWPMSAKELGDYIVGKYGNKSALFFTDDVLNNSTPFGNAKYIKTQSGKTYKVFEADRTLNKLVIEKIETDDIKQHDTINLLDKNHLSLGGYMVSRVVYENEYAVHHVIEDFDPALTPLNRPAPRIRLNEYLLGQGQEWIVSNSDFETMENEEKRSVYLIRPQYISTFINAFTRIAQEI